MHRSGLRRPGRGKVAARQGVPPWLEFNHVAQGFLRRAAEVLHGPQDFVQRAAVVLPAPHHFLRCAIVASVLPTFLGLWAPCARSQGGEGGPKQAPEAPPASGSLCLRDPEGGASTPLPLQHTTVRAQVSGPVAQVCVEQRFHNPYARPIEAVYVFPLPHEAAVNDFELHIGKRIVRGEIHERQEAQRIYDDARQRGHVAARLDQERPNIFTQSIANIMPGQEIVVRLQYVESLGYDDRGYAFVFPTVVGPRYIPGSGQPSRTLPAGWNVDDGAAPRRGSGSSPDTDRVPDASHITPPVLPPAVRSGHDLEITVDVDGGVPLGNVRCQSHAVDIERRSRTGVRVQVRPSDTIPNKDFVLRWDVAGGTPEFGMLCFRDPAREATGTFAFLLQPEAVVAPADAQPKEMIFLLDTSGSMSGEPLAKVKAAVRWALQHMNPADTFQIIRFSDRASSFAAMPLPNSPAHVSRALHDLEAVQAGGGTEMRAGIEAALCAPADPHRLRLVFFMTDGYIGNEAEILETVRQRRGQARLFAFGVGNSVNRYLLDRLAEEGRGTVDYVLLHEDTRAVVERFYARVALPCLTDLAIEWEGLEVSEAQPERLPDLFAGAPLALCGRYAQPGSGAVVVRGRRGGRDFVRRIPVVLPARAATNEALPVLWARQRIERLTSRQRHEHADELERQILVLALRHRLVSDYTSFVAVDNQVVNAAGEAMLVAQPVPIPEGVSYEGVFGSAERDVHGLQPALPNQAMRMVRSVGRVGAPAPGLALQGTGPVEGEQRNLPAGADLVMSIEPVPGVIRAGVVIEVRITLRNRGAAAVAVPQRLGVEDGTLILGVDGRLVVGLPRARSQAGPVQVLAPGESRTWVVRLPADSCAGAGRHALEIGVVIEALSNAGRAHPTAWCVVEVR